MPLERIPPADSSVASRLLSGLTAVVVRFPRTTLLLAGAAAAASIWLCATQLGFRTSRAELLSPKSDYNRRWLEYTKEFGEKEDVVVVVEGESREAVLPVLDDVRDRLRERSDRFGAVLCNIDAPKLRSKGLFYLKQDELRQIDGFLDQAAPVLEGDWSSLNLGRLAQWMGAALAGQNSPRALGGGRGTRAEEAAGDQRSAAGNAHLSAPITRHSPSDPRSPIPNPSLSDSHPNPPDADPRLLAGQGALSGELQAAIRSELPRVVGGLSAAMSQNGPYRSPWPEMTFSSPLESPTDPSRMISDDGRMGFVLLRLLEEDRQSFAQNNESIKVLRQLTAEAESRHPGVKIGLTGLPIIEYDEMRSSEQSMSRATILSFLGVLAVMIVAFGGFRHATMPMAALVVGTIWACGCVTLMVGYVNVLSIAFASILFGMGIDYGIYYVARYLQLRIATESTSAALIETSGLVGPGILTGACTSAIAFLAAGLTEFPGVAQLGIIAGCGIFLCWLAEATVLPAMIRLTDADGVRQREDLPAPLNLRFWLSPLFAWPRLSLAVGVAVMVFTAIGMPYLRYDYNLLNLQPVGLECVELEHKLFDRTNRSAWFALSMAQKPEEVAERKAAFLKLPTVERVVEVASKLPADAPDKQAVIQRIHQRLADLPRQAPEIPVTPPAELDRMLAAAQSMLNAQPADDRATAGLEQLRETLQRIPAEEYTRRVRQYQQAIADDLLARLKKLQAVSNPQPPCPDDLPEGVAARFIGRSGRYLMQVYAKTNIWDVGPMSAFVHDVRSVDPEATGNPLQVYEASRHMKRSFEQAACYALIAILPLMLLGFRRLGHTLTAVLPMGIGILETLGLMGLLDIPLNPANMIVLPLILGLGMDTGINLVHEMRSQRGRYRGAGNAVIVAVVVNTLTTMVGFGALMVANHQGLQSLGRVLTIAMGFNMFNSLLLPNLLIVGGFAPRCAEDDEDEEDYFDDEEPLAEAAPPKSRAA